MAIYVTGAGHGNSKFIYHNGLGRFHDGMAWLMQVVLFTMLGLLATPSMVWDARYIGLIVAAFLMIVARPLAVFLCMFGSPFTYNERLLVSWVGLRGGAPVMLATFPWVAGLEQHMLLFHIVFFIVLTSVVLQGMTIMPVAKALHLDLPLRIHPRVPLEFENTGNLDGIPGSLKFCPELRSSAKRLPRWDFRRSAGSADPPGRRIRGASWKHGNHGQRRFDDSRFSGRSRSDGKSAGRAFRGIKRMPAA